jgi:multimeric flavodoxin WrbA
VTPATPPTPWATALPAPPRTPSAPPQRQPRSGGNTDIVTATIAAVLEDHGIPTTTVRLCDIDLNPCIGCELCRKTGTCSRFDDGMNALYPEIERCAGLVLASPTYNYTITPQVKSFIDRLYPYFDFAEPRPGPYRARLAGRGRTLLPVGICEQNDPADMRYTIPVMRDAMEAIGYRIVDELALTGHFYRGTVSDDEGAMERIRSSAGRLADAIAPPAS